MLEEIIQTTQVQNLVWLAGMIMVVLMTIVQKASTKYKPWTWLAEQFGKAANKEMLDKQDKLEKKVDYLEEKIKCNSETDEKEKALAARRRILRFADEIRRRERHSEEYFNNVLEDVSFYKQYCKEHVNFENEKAVIAMKIIEETYTECVKTNDFL